MRDGGSCRTLFESKEKRIAIPLRQLLESRVLPVIKAGRAKRLKSLLEAAPTVLLREAEDTGETADYRDHLHAARKICEDAGDMETAGKIHKMMKPVEESEEEVDAEESPSGETTEKTKSGDKDATAKKDAAKAMEESRQRVTRLAKGFLQLQESQQPPAKLVEALVKLPDEASRLDLLESWPRSGSSSATVDRGRAPVGVPPGKTSDGKGLSLKDVTRALRN